MRAKAPRASCSKTNNSISGVDDLVAKFNGILDKMTAGQGTLGQFLVNPELYQSLTETTREFQSLAKDMRANPKKFLSIRLTLF